MAGPPASAFGLQTGMSQSRPRKRFGQGAPNFRRKKLTIAARAESDSGLFSKSANGIHDLLWTPRLCLWTDSAWSCADSANHIT
jgi:hypothetical protein